MSYLPVPFVPALSSLGVVAPDAKLYFYLTGTTTPTPVYADAGLTTPLANPVIANALGRFVDIFIDDAVTYRVRLETASGSLIDEVDPYQTALGAVSGSGGAGLISFLQSGSGAVARTVQGKLRDTVSVKDFGAVGDGVADDTAAINAAISAHTGIIYFPPGTYKITSPILTTKSHITLMGSGEQATTITSNFAAGDIICFGDGVTPPSHCSIERMAITSSVAKVSGAAIRFRNGHNLRAEKFRLLSNMYAGVQLDGGTEQFIYHVHDFEINSGVYGIQFGVDGAFLQNAFVSNGIIYGITNTGLFFQNSSGTYLSDIDVGSGTGVGIATFPSPAQIVNAAWFYNVLADTMSGDAGWSIITNGGTVTGIYGTNCWASGCGTDATDFGIRIEKGAGVISDVSFVNPTVLHNAGSGVYIGGSDKVTFISPRVNDNGTAAANTKHGFETAPNASGWQITDGYSGLGGYYTSNAQRYGLYIGTGNASYKVDGLDVRNNTTGGISDNSGATTGYVRDCFGYITSNSGTGSISAATSVNVNHGLPFTPNPQDIRVSPTADVGSGIRYWVATTGASTFTLQTSASASFSFGWSVRSKGA